MSKSSLHNFEYKVKIENSIVNDAISDIEHIEKSIQSAMNDKVGQSAIVSIKRIGDAFKNVSNNIISLSNDVAYALERGYVEIDSLSYESDDCVSRAENLIRKLGDL